MDLRPLDRSSTADACAQRLREAILHGQLSIGEKLPSERELAASFQVTRVTLRTAITRLSAEGLLVARHGSGTRVEDWKRAGGLGLLAGLDAEPKSTARDLLAARRALAALVLQRLAERRPDPTRLVAAVAQFRAVVDDGPDALALADIAVTAVVLDLADSPVFSLCLNPIAAALTSLRPLKEALYRQPQANLEGWEQLCAWLADPQPALLPLLLAGLEERDQATVLAIR